MKEYLDKTDKDVEKPTGKMRNVNERLAGLQLPAQQPRLTTKADVKQDMKTHERKEEASEDYEKFESHLPGLMMTR